MKRWFIVLSLVVFIGANLMPVVASAAGPEGPAPNSGDGVPDGSGMDGRNGPNAPDQDPDGQGPAPNSGDGVPDGSGF